MLIARSPHECGEKAGLFSTCFQGYGICSLPYSREQHGYLERVEIINIGITRAVSGVITRDGVTEQLDQIKTPTLNIVGDQDVALVPEKAEKMHGGIPNSKLVVIPGAGHTSTVEEPEAVTAAMTEFLNSQASCP